MGAKPPIPYCNGYLGSVVSDFLELVLWTPPAKLPILHFEATGKFVDEKQNEFLADIKVHPEWKEPKKLEVLRKGGSEV